MFWLLWVVRFLPLPYFLSAEPVASISETVSPMLNAIIVCQETNSVSSTINYYPYLVSKILP